jgi:hypothetical protein
LSLPTMSGKYEICWLGAGGSGGGFVDGGGGWGWKGVPPEEGRQPLPFVKGLVDPDM